MSLRTWPGGQVAEFRVCALIPTFDNPLTVRAVVERVRAQMADVADVVVVDDGSAVAGREAVAELGREGLAHTTRRAVNGGKAAPGGPPSFRRELRRQPCGRRENFCRHSLYWPGSPDGGAINRACLSRNAG